MPDNDLNKFIEVIIADATDESRRILDEIKRRKADAITNADDELLAESYREIQSGVERLRAESGRSLSERALAVKRDLYALESRLTDEIFSELRKKIDAFCSTGEYSARLSELAQEASDTLGSSGRVVVTLAERDLAQAGSLAERFPGGADFVPGLSLGGLIARDADGSREVDLSFDSLFDEQRESFQETHSFGGEQTLVSSEASK